MIPPNRPQRGLRSRLGYAACMARTEGTSTPECQTIVDYAL